MLNFAKYSELASTLAQGGEIVKLTSKLALVDKGGKIVGIIPNHLRGTALVMQKRGEK